MPSAVDSRRAHRTEIKAHVRSVLLTSACADCGEARLPCLEFHHIQPKDFGISQAVAMRVSMHRLRAEIAKCVVLCRNCHALRHDVMRAMNDNARLGYTLESAA